MNPSSMQNPEVRHRDAQPYVGVLRAVTMETMDQIVDRIPEVEAWVAERGIEPAGPSFLRYLLVDMEHGLEVEAGVPVPAGAVVEGGAHGVDGVRRVGGGVYAGLLPAGRFAVTTALCHPDELIEVTRDLLQWAHDEGLAWDVEQSPRGEVWGCRLENFLADPREQPDLRLWATELAFRLRD